MRTRGQLYSYPSFNPKFFHISCADVSLILLSFTINFTRSNRTSKKELCWVGLKPKNLGLCYKHDLEKDLSSISSFVVDGWTKSTASYKRPRSCGPSLWNHLRCVSWLVSARATRSNSGLLMVQSLNCWMQCSSSREGYVEDDTRIRAPISSIIIQSSRP